VLGFVFRQLRLALDVGERVISKPLEAPEHELDVIVAAIHRSADAIEHHVEVIEGLATSVGPLKNSVNNLNATMIDLVTLMAPMASAEHGMEDVQQSVHDVEHGVHRVERFFGFRRHTVADPATKQLQPDVGEQQPDAPA
jgi:hypothetical protein